MEQNHSHHHGSEISDIQKLIEAELHDKYEINHTTLQFECEKCDIKSIV